ncbi:hypothetical protein Tco_1453392, partial [Tanacetum coccineum]
SDRGTMEVGVDVVARIDIPDAMLMPDAVERLERVEEGLQDIYDHVIEIPFQRIEDIAMGQRGLEARSLIASGKRASLLEQVASLERSNVLRFRYYDRMRFRRLETFAARRLEHDYHLFWYYPGAKGSDDDNGNGGDGNGGDGNGGNGNGGNGNGGNGNPNENNRDARPVVRECTYQDFMKCQSLNFKGMKGVVGLTSALTWWNSHKRTVGTDVAFTMS